MRTSKLHALVGMILLTAMVVCTTSTYAQDSEPLKREAELDMHTRISSTGEISPPASTLSETTLYKDDIIRTADADGIISLVQQASPPTLSVTNLSEAKPEPENISDHILPPDGRVRTPNTRVFPASAVVLVQNNFGACSGWLYDDDTVATAAHCIHSGGQFAGVTTVTPGRNDPDRPYQPCQSISLNIVQGWISVGGPSYDYGAIKLNCNLANVTGNFGMKAEVRNSTTIVKGYYSDKPVGTQWGDTGRASSSAVPGAIVIDNDTKERLSGAPVYENFAGCGFCGFALVQSESNFGPPANFAKVIDNAVFNDYQAWR